MSETVEVNPSAPRGAGPGYYMDRSPEIGHSSPDPLTGVTVLGAFNVHRQTSFVPAHGDGRR